ncbi:MAG: phosphoglycerate kinase, partial [Sphingomonadales bacterium GWF1_63_6]
MTKPFKTLDDMGDISGKAVLVREDLNVPMHEGSVSDDTRLRSAMPTVLELADRGAKVLILAHFGRPKGQKNPEFSLSKITRPLTQVLGREVQFIPDCAGQAAIDGIAVMRPGDIAILENTRFHAGEESNDPALADAMAAIADMYVNDAFSAAHRAHASTEGIAHKLPAFAGRAMERELDALQAALGTPVKPVAAVVGGAKVSTKLDVLNHLVTKVDHLIIGGGMANTFL